ncbi:MAG: hypothetical protein ACRCTY_00740, partial [Candidatus Adiutrix sp.]
LRYGQPLLLPDAVSCEHDFKVIDELVKKTSHLGCGFLGLLEKPVDSVESLGRAISHYREINHKDPRGKPILDDRSYLALWTFTEHQNEQSQKQWLNTLAYERQMWADLKGHDNDDLTPLGDASPPLGDGPDSGFSLGEECPTLAWDYSFIPFLDSASPNKVNPPAINPRTAYAWQCWRRLASEVISPSDVIIAPKQL